MTSPTQWTWVWACSGRWWRTGKPDVLWTMGWQRVGHDWVTEQQYTKRSLHFSCWFSLLLDLFPSLLYMNVSLDIWCSEQSGPLSLTCLFLSPGEKNFFFQIFPRKIFHFTEKSVLKELTIVNPEGFSCPLLPRLAAVLGSSRTLLSLWYLHLDLLEEFHMDFLT